MQFSILSTAICTIKIIPEFSRLHDEFIIHGEDNISLLMLQLPFSSANLGDYRRVVPGFDYTNRRIAYPTDDYCIQFYDLVENTEVSEVSQLS
jgi:hypothetical protein